MIPAFPIFKKLELSDKSEVESITSQCHVYSDFEFTSLWSWDVKDEMEISKLKENLVMRFTDYLTGEAFYTVFGFEDVSETLDEVIQYSEEGGCGSTLHLIPNEIVEKLDPERFDIQESRDHFDYILSLERYLTFSGAKLKSRRNFFNSFVKNFPNYETVILDLNDISTRKTVTDLYRNWQEQKGFLSHSESFAYDRFVHAADKFEHMALGLNVDGKLIAFHVSALPKGEYANGLFEKGDTSYSGVYQALMHEVSKALLARGKKFLNYEQDLGIESLRRAKLAFDPISFQKKFSVAKKALS